jgi:hypothetical protein
LSPGDLRRVDTIAVARAVIAGLVATIIAVNLLAGLGRTGLGWLAPVVIPGFVFTRLPRRRRSRLVTGREPRESPRARSG